jgi:hypothetical protein
MRNNLQKRPDCSADLISERQPAADPVISDVEALLHRIRASVGMLDTAMRGADADVPESSGDLFILDDVTPRYLKIRSILAAVDAKLHAALTES